MSGFLKNLKDLFVVSDEELLKAEKGDANRKKDSEPSEPDSNPATADIKDTGITIETGVEGEVEQEFLDILLGSMTKNNQEGYDYLEFKQALQSLKKMNMDEATRFQSAFAMAQTMGASKDNLVNSAKEYLSVLKDEEQKFLMSVANQRKSRVEEKKQELLRMDQWVKDKQAEIEKLKEQIKHKQKLKEEALKDLTESARKIDVVEKNFEKSYEFLSGQINEDLNKIKTIVK